MLDEVAILVCMAYVDYSLLGDRTIRNKLSGSKGADDKYHILI